MGNWRGLNTVKWSGYEWVSRPLWGEYHPNKKLTYYYENANYIDGDGNMVLDIIDTPKTFTTSDGTTITRSIGTGYVRTTDQFKYGTFEFVAKLPKGRWVWPALWLSSDQGWPPEIDVMEGWTEKRTDYSACILFDRVRPTMHWSENADENTGKHILQGVKNILKGILKINTWNTYKCVWTPEYIDIYYNKKKIKRFDNPEMLSHMNKEGYGMHVILDTMVESNFSKSDYSLYRKLNAPMMVKSFKYTPYNGK